MLEGDGRSIAKTALAGARSTQRVCCPPGVRKTETLVYGVSKEPVVENCRLFREALKQPAMS